MEEERRIRDDETREIGDREHVRHRGEVAGAGIDREAQHDEYGGFNLGAAFFGWLVAIGLTALLTALLSAAGAAIGLTEVSDAEAQANAETISIVGGALLILVVAVGYYAGGYVAGRMSRFDGGRQGLAVWLIGLVVTIAAVAVGWVFGDQYNVLDRVDLPSIPIPRDQVTVGGILTGIVVLALTLVTSMTGGKVGEHYHRRVDRAHQLI